MKSYCLFLLGWMTVLHVIGQNWPTFGGGSTRDGRSKITGPQDANTAYWTVTNAASTTLGNAVYTFGDKFVTSRITFSPYAGRIECRNLQDGALLWTSQFIASNSILYAIGFTEDAVYAHDYATDTIYALDSGNGTIKWRSSLKSSTFGAYPGCVFACNGDPIVNGPVGSSVFTMRLDKYTGIPVWTNNTILAIMPAAGMIAGNGKVYRLTGGITLPIKLTAIDIETGVNLYASPAIPGDGDQENPITMGTEGELFFWRDGGNLYSYKDNGSSFSQNWSYIPQTTSGSSLNGNLSIGMNGDLYAIDNSRLKRFNTLNGTPEDSTAVYNMSQPSVSIAGDSSVILNTGTGAFHCFTADLQTLKYTINTPGSVYCNPSLGKDGIMVVTAAGSSIRAFKPGMNLAPVADFRVSNTKILAGQTLNFFDQSSYGATVWAWEFPGASPSSSFVQNPSLIQYNTPGIYDVKLRVSNALGSDSVVKTCYIEVAEATVTPDVLAGEQPIVYPNPTSGTIRLEIPGKLIPCSFIITDFTGRVRISGVLKEPHQTISLESMAVGIYFLQFSRPDQKPVKIILN